MFSMHLGDPTIFFDALGGSNDIFRCTWGTQQHFSMHLGDPTTFFDALGGSNNIFRCTWGIQQNFSMHLGDPAKFFDALEVVECIDFEEPGQSPQYVSILGNLEVSTFSGIKPNQKISDVHPKCLKTRFCRLIFVSDPTLFFDGLWQD